MTTKTTSATLTALIDKATAATNKPKASAMFALHTSLTAIDASSLYRYVAEVLADGLTFEIFAEGLKLSGRVASIDADKLNVLRNAVATYGESETQSTNAVNTVVAIIRGGFMEGDAVRTVWTRRAVSNALRIGLGELVASPSMKDGAAAKSAKADFNAAVAVTIAAALAGKGEIAGRWAGIALHCYVRTIDAGGDVDPLKLAKVAAVSQAHKVAGFEAFDLKTLISDADKASDVAKAERLAKAIALVSENGYKVNLLTSARRDAKQVAKERELVAAE